MEPLFQLSITAEIDATWWSFLVLVAAGVFAGFVNTVAGGGSMLTVPALMLLGMPADYANGTNRVGILQQSLTGIRGFNRSGKLDRSAILPVVVPTMSGAVLGALAAVWISPDTLKPVLLGTMIAMALLMLVAPNVMAPPEGTPTYTLKERPLGLLVLFGAGLYGGFVQAGVGFILIAGLALGLRYDLVRTNALKAVCTALFSVAALAVFIVSGHVDWIPGIVLAAAMTVGALFGVRFALTVSQRVFKWLLFIMVCLACGLAFLFA